MTSATPMTDKSHRATPHQTQRRFLCFWPLALIGVLVLVACGTSTPETSYRPARLPSEKELRSLPRKEAMAILLDTYNTQLNAVVKNVRDHIPPRYGGPLEGSEIVYTLE